MSPFQLSSDQINELATALSKAQSEMTFASKDSKNPHFKNDYASLASVIGSAKVALAKHGLSVVQATVPTEHGLILVSTLMHSSGQWQRSYTPILMTKQDAQGMGSALTYARRYSYSALVGLAQDDDDGEGSVGPRNTTTAPVAASRPVVEASKLPQQIASTIRKPDALLITDPLDYVVQKGKSGWAGFKIRDIIDGCERNGKKHTGLGFVQFQRDVDWLANESTIRDFDEIKTLLAYKDEIAENLKSNHLDALADRLSQDDFDNGFKKAGSK